MRVYTRENAADVLGTFVEALTMPVALQRMEADLAQRRKGYVCFVGVHGIMEAHRDPALAQIYAQAAMTVPDGMPTVWIGRHQGHKHMQRLAGPELMEAVFASPTFAGYTHLLYGGKPGIAEQLRDILQQKYPWVRIVGTYTPPFRELNPQDEGELIALVRRSKPDMVWVGISTPKQERFMAQYLPMLDATLLLGVGAAFDFHTGHIHDAPQWVKSMGMQWLHRLCQDPCRLWKRYLVNNVHFVLCLLLQALGLRRYPARFHAAG